jgi:hypothetical protein
MERAIRLGWTINIFFEYLNMWTILEMTHPRFPRWVSYISDSPNMMQEIENQTEEHAQFWANKDFSLS